MKMNAVTILNTPFVQFALPIVVTFIVAAWLNGKRLDDFKSDTYRRFEDVNRRFDQVDRHFDAMDKRFDRLETLLVGTYRADRPFGRENVATRAVAVTAL